jgi:PAS domain S-box-containing protein
MDVMQQHDDAPAGPAPAPPAARPGRTARPDPARRFTAACVASAAVVLVAALVAASRTVDAASKALFSDLLLVPLALAAGLAAAATAREARGRTRGAWAVMAAASLAWAGAELTYTVLARLAPDAATPNLSDVLYLGGSLLAAFALVGFYPRREGGSERLRNVVAALVITGAVLFISRALVLPEIITAAEGTPLAQAVYLAYPLVDVALASLSLIVLARVRASARLHLGLLTAGLLAYAAADTMYAYSSALGTYVSGGLADLGWVAGYLLFMLAALAPAAGQPTEPAAGRASEHPGGLASLVVYVPVLLAVVVAALSGVPTSDGVLVGAGAAVLVLFGLRQYLLARDTSRLHATLERRVTELQSTSTALRLLAQQNERTVQSVSEGVFGVDAEGVLAFANPSAVQMLGRGVTALVGRHEHELFHAPRPDSPAGDCLVRRALRTGTATRSSDEVFVRADGSRFPVEVAVGPIVESGTILGAVIVFHDITQRREVERMKDEFISVVSHELRTPLTAIRGSLGLMAGGAIGELPERADRLVGLALESTERLTRLINDMLDIERIESGATTMEFTECGAADIVRAAVDGVRSIAADVPLTLAVGPVDGRVHADSDRIVQTLTNLLGNAIKFSPPQTTITVSALPVGGLVQFSVADQGRGIPADKLESIFERFEQVDSSDSRQKGGTGLGLSISRTIVRRHGGRIWVDSEPGLGSTFHFTLPSADEPAPGTGARDAVVDARHAVGERDEPVLPTVSAGARAPR